MAVDSQTPSVADDSSTEMEASFAETALKLGGKSEDEARRTGAIDTADDQVEALFAPQYQTVHSPAHRAVWDRGVPVAEFVSDDPEVPADVSRVMAASLDIAARHRREGTLLDERQKVSGQVLADLAEVGYWGLLVDREYGGRRLRSRRLRGS